MKPQPAISGRIISEKRAAAARANGAKSRGPVTAQGRANSSRNSFRHGLRAKTHGVVDQDSLDRLATLLASYTRLFQPQSEVERWLVETMALARWRRTRCWQQETEVLNGEIRRLKPLLPDEDPFTLMALAFQSLSGNGCSLDLINRIESRCDRQYDHPPRSCHSRDGGWSWRFCVMARSRPSPPRARKG